MNKEERKEFEKKRYKRRKEEGYFQLKREIQKQQKENFKRTNPDDILELIKRD